MFQEISKTFSKKFLSTSVSVKWGKQCSACCVSSCRQEGRSACQKRYYDGSWSCWLLSFLCLFVVALLNSQFLEYNTAPARLCSFFFWSFDAVAMDEVLWFSVGADLNLACFLPVYFVSPFLSLSLSLLSLSLYARHLPSPPVWP